MILFLLAVCFSRCAVCYVNNRYGSTPNVRTVLFTKHDMCEKNCWTRYESGLLLTRFLMQDLLPRKVPVNVTYLDQYITLCMRTVQDTVSTDEGVEMMMHAFADTFGGYLHAYGLPLAKEAYYEGRLDMNSVSELYRTEDWFKEYLKTDGEGWTRPMHVTKPLGPVSPLKIHLDKHHDYCDELILKESENDDCDKTEDEYNCPGIPLPFFDDCREPRAVAVPMKEQSLHSLSNNASQGVLSRYYEMSINCIHQEARCKSEYRHCYLLFNKKFLKWMTKHLLCHLNDEMWYPAFFGVKRVFRAAERAVDMETGDPDSDDCEEISSLSFFMIVAFLLGLFWLIIALCLLCRRCCTFKDDLNQCRDNCQECANVEGKTDKARLLSYNMSCWTGPRGDSTTDWCQCNELNYVEVERFEVEEESKPECVIHGSPSEDNVGLATQFYRDSGMINDDDHSETSDS